jgi:hypothetical protein
MSRGAARAPTVPYPRELVERRAFRPPRISRSARVDRRRPRRLSAQTSRLRSRAGRRDVARDSRRGRWSAWVARARRAESHAAPQEPTCFRWPSPCVLLSTRTSAPFPRTDPFDAEAMYAGIACDRASRGSVLLFHRMRTRLVRKRVDIPLHAITLSSEALPSIGPDYYRREARKNRICN